MGWRAGLMSMIAVLALGCEDGVVQLVVELKTDFVPGAEIVGVRTELDGELLGEIPATERLDFLAGERVAERSGLSPGDRTITVSLLAPSGEVVASRRLRLDLDRSLAVTVVITRDCRDVSCPGPADPEGFTTCVAGGCADPGCSELDPAACPEPECEAASDCPMSDPCASATCEDGVCLYRVDPSACGVDEFCVAETGCAPRPDSRPDAGAMDAGFDAEVDAGFDAGVDAGPMDAGPPPPGLLVSALSVGAQHNCAQATSGALVCWGNNTSRQSAPSGLIVDRPAPHPEGVVEAVVAYFNSTCVRRVGGEIACFGHGAQFQLGVDLGMGVDLSATAVVPSPLPTGAILVRGNTPCAWTPTMDALDCWGFNFTGQVGIGTTSDRELPGTAVMLSAATVDAETGGNHSCAVTVVGDVYCWGSNPSRELGHGLMGGESVPVQVMGLPADPTYRLGLGESHSCAVDGARRVFCWGDNSFGQLGLTGDPIPTAARVTDVDADQVCGGEGFTCFRDGASVSCLGINDRGQLGRGTTSPSESALAPVMSLPPVSDLQCGKYHACAVLETSQVMCWGRADEGQLGHGVTPLEEPTPVLVLAP